MSVGLALHMSVCAIQFALLLLLFRNSTSRIKAFRGFAEFVKFDIGMDGSFDFEKQLLLKRSEKLNWIP